ncbi:MAG: choice-of-anchor E domain-containing protein, partial [Pseudomonadota bacterium]
MRTLLAAAAFAALSVSAQAATITDSATIATAFTNYATTATVSQFDGSLGTLNSVTVTLEGIATGEANAESLDAAPTTLTLNLAATIVASFAGSELVAVVPTVSVSNDVDAFDGVIDFGGTSGFGTGLITGTATDSNTLTTALAPFIGTGT